MTLPDLIVDLLRAEGGEYRDPDDKVYAAVASRLGVRDVTSVMQACSALVTRGLLVRAQGRASGRYLRLTEKGVEAARLNESSGRAPALRPAADPPVSPVTPATITFEPVTVDDFKRAKSRLKKKDHIGHRLVEGFLATGEKAAVVRGGARGHNARQVAQLVLGAARSHHVSLTTLVRNDDVWIARRDEGER